MTVSRQRREEIITPVCAAFGKFGVRASSRCIRLNIAWCFMEKRSSMCHQHWKTGVRADKRRHASEDRLPQMAVAIASHDQQVGFDGRRSIEQRCACTFRYQLEGAD